MQESYEEKINFFVNKLIDDHLFNPTDKIEWINKLIQEGLSENEAKRAFKIAAQKYHLNRYELINNKKRNSFGNIIAYTGAAIFTFTVWKMVFIILVLLVIAFLGFLFGF